MYTKARWFFVLTFAAGLAFTASAVIPSVEKILPDDTLLMLTMPDFAKARQAYRSSPQTQLWDDPAMKAFKDKFLTKLSDDLIQPLEKELGVKFEDYTNLPQGQITFAIIQNGWPTTEGANPGMLFLLDTKDKNTQLTKNLADLRKKWVEAGKTLRTEKLRNIEFSVLPISDKDLPKTLRKFSGADKDEFGDTTTNAPKNEIYVGQYESLLIVGTAAKPIEKVLVRLTGGEMPALGDLATYEANRLALFRDSPLYGWVNAKSLLDSFTRKQAKEDSDTPDPFAMFSAPKILTALGIGGLKTVAFSVQIGSEGSTVQFFASLPGSSRPGLFAVFPDAKDASPPPFVPADAVKFERYRVDGKKAWTTLQKVLSDISPQAKTGINFMIETANAAAKEKDPDFDLNKNFFGNLGDDIISYEKAPRGMTLAELNSAPSLLLLGSPNPDQIVAAFKYLLLLVNPQGAEPKEREFLGRKIYSATLPGAAGMAGPNRPGARTLNYAANSGYVAISTDASMVEEFLRSSDSQRKTLRETPGLTDAIAKAGGPSTGLLGFENQAETTRVAFEALKNTSATNNASSAAMMLGLGNLPNAGSFKDWMDFSLLPPFDKVSKYFGIEVYTASLNPDGLMVKMYAPVPAGLRK